MLLRYAGHFRRGRHPLHIHSVVQGGSNVVYVSLSALALNALRYEGHLSPEPIDGEGVGLHPPIDEAPEDSAGEF